MRELWQEIKQKLFAEPLGRKQHRCPECGCKSFVRKGVSTNKRRHFGISNQRAYYKCTVCKCEWYILNNKEDF